MTTTELADRYLAALQALIAEERAQYRASLAGEGLLSVGYHHAVLEGLGRAMVLAHRLAREERDCADKVLP